MLGDVVESEVYAVVASTGSRVYHGLQSLKRPHSGGRGKIEGEWCTDVAFSLNRRTHSRIISPEFLALVVLLLLANAIVSNCLAMILLASYF